MPDFLHCSIYGRLWDFAFDTPPINGPTAIGRDGSLMHGSALDCRMAVGCAWLARLSLLIPHP